MRTAPARDYSVTSSLTNITYCHSFADKHPDQLADKMSDSDDCFDLLRDISSPTTLNYTRKKVTDSINCEELAAASADIGARASTCAADTNEGHGNVIFSYYLILWDYYINLWH